MGKKKDMFETFLNPNSFTQVRNGIGHGTEVRNGTNKETVYTVRNTERYKGRNGIGYGTVQQNG